MRIGQGFDVHAFAPDRTLILGGVTIPYELGLAGHSDADVLIHALCDALLGAAGLGDIGHHFPDDDAAFKDVDSRILLRRVMDTLRANKLHVVNADTTIIAQAPKLAAYIQAMRENLAADLAIDSGRMNVKATTTERLGFTGREQGIAAMAVVLLDDS